MEKNKEISVILRDSSRDCQVLAAFSPVVKKFVFSLVFARPQRAYKQYVLECSAEYKVNRMPYSIPPKFKSPGSKKVTPSGFYWIFTAYLHVSVSDRWFRSAAAHLNAVLSFCTGGDSCDVEQARQSVLCSSVDHYSGCSSWLAVTVPAHISTIQGKKLINNPLYNYT